MIQTVTLKIFLTVYMRLRNTHYLDLLIYLLSLSVSKGIATRILRFRFIDFLCRYPKVSHRG